MMLTFVQVHRGYGNVHLYGSAIIDRAVNFMISYDVTGNPDVMWQEIAQQMIIDQPTMLVLAVLDDDEQVVGHLIAEMQNHHGILVIMVTQAELDPNDSLQKGMMMKRAWSFVTEWATKLGAKKIMCWALDESRAAIFEKLGLEMTDKVIMEMPVLPGGE